MRPIRPAVPGGVLWGVLLTVTGPTATAIAADARAVARASVAEPMSVRLSWPMAMPSVRGGADGASFLGVMPSMSMGMTMPANARLVIRREDDSGQPVTAPASFEVTRVDSAAVVLRTASKADGARAGDYEAAPLAGGVLQGRAAASIEVARGPAAGPERLSGLQVVVQYN